MSFWTTVYRAALTVLVVLLVFGLCSIFIPLIRENRERERKVTALEEELRTKQEGIVNIRKQQEQFQTDPTFVENIAREEFGKAKPGETIYRFTQ
jgi:cell division protein FtsB